MDKLFSMGTKPSTELKSKGKSKDKPETKSKSSGKTEVKDKPKYSKPISKQAQRELQDKYREEEEKKVKREMFEETRVVKNLTQLKEEINRELKTRMKVEGNIVTLGFSDKKAQFVLNFAKDSECALKQVLDVTVLFLNTIRENTQHVPGVSVVEEKKELITIFIERAFNND